MQCMMLVLLHGGHFVLWFIVGVKTHGCLYQKPYQKFPPHCSISGWEKRLCSILSSQSRLSTFRCQLISLRIRITCELFSKHTHLAIDTNIVVFRPSEPHQYSINICTQVYTLVHMHTHKHQYHNSMSTLCVFTHTCNCHKYTHPCEMTVITVTTTSNSS